MEEFEEKQIPVLNARRIRNLIPLSYLIDNIVRNSDCFFPEIGVLSNASDSYHHDLCYSLARDVEQKYIDIIDKTDCAYYGTCPSKDQVLLWVLNENPKYRRIKDRIFKLPNGSYVVVPSSWIKSKR